jgi:hypothetical protein
MRRLGAPLSVYDGDGEGTTRSEEPEGKGDKPPLKIACFLDSESAGYGLLSKWYGMIECPICPEAAGNCNFEEDADADADADALKETMVGSRQTSMSLLSRWRLVVRLNLLTCVFGLFRSLSGLRRT